MYVLLFALLFGAGALFIHRAVNLAKPKLMWLGISLIVAGLILIVLMAFWFEMLWFDAIGFSSKLLSRLTWKSESSIAPSE